MKLNIPNNKKLIIFDGICNLCNASVLYIIKHDKKDMFKFTALQSEIGLQLIKEFNIDTKKNDSILLYNPSTHKLFTKSSAVLHVSKHLGFPLTLLSVFFIIPTMIRNWVYDFIAANRYKWYGKKTSCMVPTSELESKFM